MSLARRVRVAVRRGPGSWPFPVPVPLRRTELPKHVLLTSPEWAEGRVVLS